MHVIEEDLVLHYYGELTPRRGPGDAPGSVTVPAAFRRLQRVLMSVDDAAVRPRAAGTQRTVGAARAEPAAASGDGSLASRALAPGVGSGGGV
jgi:hypothetical protein